jgi:hypothetical protein
LLSFSHAFLIHRANHPDLTYRGGQEPIVHLEADLHSAVRWANGHGRRLAFSLSNGGAYYRQFRNHLADLGEVNWPAVASADFRLAEVEEGEQAEFLVHGSFPWSLMRRIGVHSPEIAQKVDTAVNAAAHRPTIEVRSDWYY